MKLKRTPEQWKTENWQKFEAIRQILKEISAKQSHETLDEILLDRVWHACACAATYEREFDTNYQMRKALAKEHSKDKAKARAAIVKAREKIGAIPQVAKIASANALVALARQGIEIRSVKPMPTTEIVDLVLEGLEQALEGDALGWYAGPFQHRTQDGCLGYPESIEGIPNLAKVSTMLLFALILYFRKHSIGVDIIQNHVGEGTPDLNAHGIQEGEPMPDNGESRYNLAFRIVQLALPKSKVMTDVDARGRLAPVLSANAGLTLMTWPHDQ